MNVFSAKSIGLYSLAVGSAIGFFQIVTSYGEAQIAAPIAVSGNYLITAQNLPDCLQQKQLILKLQQSGVYLNASIVKNTPEITSTRDTRPTFSGRLQERKLSLSGTLPPEICPQPSQLQITGSISKTSTQIDRPQLLQGQLRITNGNLEPASPVSFTGTLQPADRKSQPH
jgi:hypothetical protein